MNRYYEKIQKRTDKAYEKAKKARQKNLDPSNEVEIPQAKDMAARVEGIVGPEDIAERIRELQKKDKSREEIEFQIIDDILEGKYGEYDSKAEKIEQAVRTALTIETEGITIAGTEGISGFTIKQNPDGTDYLAVKYAGPIRAAGGTSAAKSVIFSDYAREKLGISPYKATNKQIERYAEEVEAYHEKASRLQYHPSEDEVKEIAENCPVCIDGGPTENIEVKANKNVEGIDTNNLRGGMCLVLAEGVAQKKKKVLKTTQKHDLGWEWLENIIEVKKEDTDGKEEEQKKEITPVTKFMANVVGGRPVFSYPMREGGFRLRYGKSRNNGIAAQSIHPAAMIILDEFTAIGTQIKTERPGKAASVTPCDEIEPPIVKLKNGEVIKINSIQQAKKIKDEIEEILFLGDILATFGDFLDNNHMLVPSGICEEWWKQILKEKTKEKDVDVEEEINNPREVDPKRALELSEQHEVPMHPKYTYHYGDLNLEEIMELWKWLEEHGEYGEYESLKGEKVLYLTVDNLDKKRHLERICIPHKKEGNTLKIKHGEILTKTLGLNQGKNINQLVKKSNNTMELINKLSNFPVYKKAPVYVGTRMGRPEKSKPRKMSPAPHGLIPLGGAGGKERLINKAANQKTMKVEKALLYCPECNEELFNYKCPDCGTDAKLLRKCRKCGRLQESEKCESCGNNTISYHEKTVNIREEFNRTKKKIQKKSRQENNTIKATSNQNKTIPEKIKGVKGTSNEHHLFEPLEKAVLRAKNEVSVFMDGTIRYDTLNIPLTHFRPEEIGVSVEKLKELGYKRDYKGNKLKTKDQTLELKPNDILIPQDSVKYMMNVAEFVDETLEKYYDMEKYYNIDKKEDLVGKLAIGLAPHTSAGVIARIIGFNRAKAGYAHPYFHCAKRRNCVHPETKIVISDKKEEKISSKEIGKITEKLMESGAKVKEDGEFKLIECPEHWEVFSIDPKTHETVKRNIKHFLKGPVPKEWIKIKTALGREFVMTPDHNFLMLDEDNLRYKKARNIKEGDELPININWEVREQKVPERIDLIKEFLKIEDKAIKEQIRIINASDYFKKVASKKGVKETRELLNLSKQHSRTLSAWYRSVPLSDFETLLEKDLCSIEELPEVTKLKMRQTKMDTKLEITDELMRLLGYFISEGYARKNESTNQISFRICDEEIREDLLYCIEEVFGFKPYVSKEGSKISISRKIIYYLFTKIFETGSSAKDKRIPPILFNLEKKKTSEFLSAYFDGDGSVLVEPKRLRFYSASKSLIKDIGLLLSRFGILARYFKSKKRLPGKKIRERYKELGKEPKKFSLHHLNLGKKDIIKFAKICNPISSKKKKRISKLSELPEPKNRYAKANQQITKLKKFSDFANDRVKSVEKIKEKENSYCLDIETESGKTISKNVLWGNQLFQIRCDGDEDSFMLLMDALLNFSREYLPDRPGGSEDAPLVLSTRINPSEIDDEVHAMETVNEFPLEFYEATQEMKNPREVEMDIVEDKLDTEHEFELVGFTHDTTNFDVGPRRSKYTTLKAMQEKVDKQMELGRKIRAVDEKDMATKLINLHFMKDIYGNLRAFGQQTFRCVDCNKKFRRVPLIGKCTECGGKILLTVHEKGIEKYLSISREIAEKYDLSPYLKQRLDLIEQDLDQIFETKKSKQQSLAQF